MSNKCLEGTFATVSIQNDVAIKSFKDTISIDVWYRELFYLSLFQQTRISKILEADSKSFTITMSKYDGDLVDLACKLNHIERIALSDKIIDDILPVINLLHSRGVSHRDIKAPNIFYRQIDDDYEFFLGDFSKTTIKDTKKLYDTSLYSDPCQECDNRQTDLWMFGIVIWNFITRSASSHYSDLMMEYHAPESPYLDFRIVYPYIISDKLYNHLSNLLLYDGTKRLTSEITNPVFPDTLTKLVNKKLPDAVIKKLMFAAEYDEWESDYHVPFTEQDVIDALF